MDEILWYPNNSPDELKQEKELLKIFADDICKTVKAIELYSALCNNSWQGKDFSFSYTWRSAGEVVANIRNSLELERKDPEICELCGKDRKNHHRHRYKSGISGILEKKGKEPLWLERITCDKKGEIFFTPGYLGSECYLDFYCIGNEGQVAEWVRDKFQKAGYTLK